MSSSKNETSDYYLIQNHSGIYYGLTEGYQLAPTIPRSGQAAPLFSTGLATGFGRVSLTFNNEDLLFFLKTKDPGFTPEPVPVIPKPGSN